MGEEKRPAVEAAVSQAITSRDSALTALSELAKKIGDASQEDRSTCSAMMDAIRKAACKQMTNKKDVSTFALETKKHTQSIFKRQSALLQQIKVLKQDYRNGASLNSSEQALATDAVS